MELALELIPTAYWKNNKAHGKIVRYAARIYPVDAELGFMSL
jgi:hypothetical protein